MFINMMSLERLKAFQKLMTSLRLKIKKKTLRKFFHSCRLLMLSSTPFLHKNDAKNVSSFSCREPVVVNVVAVEDDVVAVVV